MPHTSLEIFKFVKPLKRSQKVRLRKELEKQNKLGITKQENLKLEKCDWAPSKLLFGGKSRVTKDSWEYKLL